MPWEYVQVQPEDATTGGPGEFYVQITPSRRDDYDGDLGRIPVTDPHLYLMYFNSFRLLKEVLLVVADAPEVWIDNEHGAVMRGSDVAVRIRGDPDWNLGHSSRLRV